MKPDWKDAPEWAKYVAKDWHGDWMWFENEPSAGEYHWMTDYNGRVASASDTEDDNWQETLERRP